MIYYQTDDFTIHQGNTLVVLKTLPDESVNCIVTSPPYWGLRDYGTATWEGGTDPNCDHSMPEHELNPLRGQNRSHVSRYSREKCHKCGAIRIDEQIGLEATIEEHISVLVAVFRECRRILRPDGVMWINYGDTYMQQQGLGFNANKRLDDANRNIKLKSPLPSGNLLLLGAMLALALQQDGWILRDEVIWYKPNPMPESVKNRCTKAHEKVYMFAKKMGYYCEQLTEPRASMDFNPPRGSKGTSSLNGGRRDDPPVMGANGAPPRHTGRRDKGNNKTFRGGLYTEGRQFDNDADKAKTSIGQKPADSIFRNKHSVWTIPIQGGFTSKLNGEHYATYPPTLIEDPIKCTCPIGGIVLDPFGGSGTTAEVALNQCKKAILIELNPGYCEIAKQRLLDPIEQLLSEVQQ